MVVFSEMVTLLMARGDYEAALRLEQVWNDLARVHSFSLRCAYPKNGFHGTEHAAEFLEFAKSIRKLFLTEANRGSCDFQ